MVLDGVGKRSSFREELHEAVRKALSIRPVVRVVVETDLAKKNREDDHRSSRVARRGGLASMAGRSWAFGIRRNLVSSLGKELNRVV